MLIQSFEQISANEYRIFGLDYLANQILELSASGQRTLCGNTGYYFSKNFKFAPNDQKYIKNNFNRFVNPGKKFGIKIDKVIMIPTEYKGTSLYSKVAPQTMPKEFNFTKPNNPCNVLCIPFEGDNKPLPFGVFAYNRGSLDSFAYNAAFNALCNADDGADFQRSFRDALMQMCQNGGR